MGRLPKPSIQNNSDVSQGLSPRLAAQSTTRAVGILMPLWNRSEQIKVQAIPGLISWNSWGHRPLWGAADQSGMRSSIR
jgi:hypothetical protein